MQETDHKYIPYKDEQKLLDLLKISKERKDFFEIDSQLFIGDRIGLVKEYVRLNPSKKFIIWLIDKGLRVEIKAY